MPAVPRRKDDPPLMLSQLRVLRALQNGEVLGKFKLCEACGWSKVSATIRAAINGIPPNSSSGPERKGLIALGLVRRVELEIDGKVEVAWEITDAGSRVWAEQGRYLPPPRSRSLSVNNRYKGGDDAADTAEEE